MATLRSAQASTTVRCSRASCVRPALPVRRPVQIRAERKAEKSSQANAVALTTVASTMLVAGNAMATTEIVQLGGLDPRVTAIASIFVPALGWVAFNALQPLMNQVSQMDDDNRSSKRSIAVGSGLGVAATLLVAEQAQAASEVAQLGGLDPRVAAIGSIFVPALAWVAFNALQPLLNQVSQMDEDNRSSKRSIAVGSGLGVAATLLVAEQAQAASEVAQLSGLDPRVAAIGSISVPALAWVAFNALVPFMTQFTQMDEDNRNSKRSIAVGSGLGVAATLLVAEQAQAASEVAQLSGGLDPRIAAIGSIFVPVLGWVAFNALAPLLSQAERMDDERKR
eukprot:gene26598-18380_t